MTKLVLTFNDKVIKTFPFDKQSLTIGRNKDNDMMIDNLAVSGFHARIDMVGSDIILTDLQSLNGVFVNEKQVTSHKLRHNDQITIGKHVIVFLKNEESDREPAGNIDMTASTMYIDTKKAKELRQKAAQGGTLAIPGKKGQLSKGVITYINGGVGEVELIKKVMTIGKDPSSDIRVSGMLVAKTAGTITMKSKGYFISFSKGMAKIKVNGEALKASQMLKEFDTIEIGSSKLQFYFA
ncbi:FHA domain-containing protein [Candidatus Magnetomoraceae bacterium gMMP-15]